MTPTLFEKDFGDESLSVRLLRHVERYRVTVPHVVARLFFSSIAPEKRVAQARAALEELSACQQLVRIQGRSAFAKDAYLFPGHDLKEGNDLARLWYCCLMNERRYYATHSEVKPLFWDEDLKPVHHNYFHALATEEGGDVLYRLYLCRAERKSALGQIKNIIRKQSKAFANWVDEGSYGVAIIVHTKQKASELAKAIAEGYGGNTPLEQQARFTISIVPDEAGYAAAIKHYEKEINGNE